MDNRSKTKRITVNTILLYVRMLFIMLVTLYATRLVLHALGIDDYGLYNVVAGVVTLMSFINGSLSTATQRYYAYSLGDSSPSATNIQHIFSASVNIYCIICLLVIILGETLGLWFVMTQLNYPAERGAAVMWIYQCALFSFVISMLAVPYLASIIAHERMGAYALIGIVDCLLKLGIVFLLPLFALDRLVFYGVLLLAVQIVTSSLYVIKAKRISDTCRYRKTKDIGLHKQLFAFAGWSLFGSLAYAANNQGSNILMNIFFGPAVNAARSVSMQVSTAIASFANSFFMATRPPMIKSYAEHNYDYLMRLFYLSNKYTYYLLLMICLPCVVEMRYVLNFWLAEVTPEMVVFTQLAILYSVIVAMQNPITIIIQATGRIKKYFLIVESITLLTLPLTYVCFKIGCRPESTFVVMIIAFTVAHVARLVILKSQVKAFRISQYLVDFVVPAMLITLLTLAAVLLVGAKIDVSPMLHFLISFGLSVVMTGGLFVLIGCNKEERKAIKVFLKLRFNEATEPVSEQ